MQADKGTFRELMTQDRQFVVPLYQRHYRWRTEQHGELWADVLEQYKAVADLASTVPRHFIGSVVAVALKPNPFHDFRTFRIVDGQQRLTTLSLAIAALRDVASEDDPEARSRYNGKYLVNTTEPTGSEHWQRLVPGDEDASEYLTVLTDPGSVSGHTAIGVAYRFFRHQIEQLRAEGELQVDRLSTTIGDRLALVFVTVEEDERPHKIFESINATGVALTQADLLRNYLFMALGDRSNTVYGQHWRPLEKELSGDGLEGLVRDDLQSAGQFVKQGDVYRTARTALEKIAGDLDALAAHVQHLARKGKYYALFLRPADPDGVASTLGVTKKALRHLAFLRAWGASTTYPLLLHIYGEVDAGRATQEEAESCVEALESFVVRRYLASVRTNVLNRLFIQLVTTLSADEPIDTALRRELSRADRWPDDVRVREGVIAEPFYTNGRAHQQRLVLERLESSLRAEVDVDFGSSDLSIEHVLPQTLSADWKAELAAAGYDAQEVFDRVGHTLGNLTLTGFNSQLSNHLFERKQEIMEKGELRLNAPLLTATAWGPDEIRARAILLAGAATDLWSAPVVGVASAYNGFDWTRVDQAVQSIPAGRWTSYGDLADLVGTAAQPTANHVSREPSLSRAYRVLSSDGSLSFNFTWHDENDTRDPLEVLTGEGVSFTNDRADQAQRMGPVELEALLDGNDMPVT